MKIRNPKIIFVVLLLAVVASLMGTPVFAVSDPCSGFNAQINPGNQTVYENLAVSAQGGANKGTSISCAWSQNSGDGTQVTFDKSQCLLSFTAPKVDSGIDLHFTLSVTGNVNGSTCSDIKSTKISIENSANQAPTASATATPAVVNEGGPVTLDGSASSDPDNDPLTYEWTQTVGTPVTINNASQAIATFTAPAEQYPNGETLTFMLTVSDGSLSGSTTVNVNVNSVNQPPTAAISPQCPISVDEGATVQLDGSGSSDPDQGALAYQWSQAHGIPNADLTGVNLSAQSISFTAPHLTSDLNTMKFGLTVTDNGGLFSSAECDILVMDVTPPTVQCSAPDQAIWYGANVMVNCTASDVASGLADTNDSSFSLTTSVSAGTETGSASTDSKDVCDNADNCITAGPYTFKVDKKAPTVSCGTADTSWHATDQPVTCTATDGGSGPASQTTTLSTNVLDGTETSNASTDSKSVCDNVNNCATAGPVTGFMIDKKAPTAITFIGSISDGDNYYFGFVPAVPTCTATDGGSGLQSCAVTGYGNVVGSHMLTATATDMVGNQSTKNLTYNVLAWTLKGFYQPVDMNGITNTVKGGSTVPLKFEIFAGPTELTSTSAIKSIQTLAVSCSSMSPAEDAVTDDALATGGTSLRYDLTAGQFIFNWQTPKSSGACYRVTMTTQDGSTLSANFKLK